MAIVVLVPWTAGSLIQCVMRSDSLLLQGAMLLFWMAAATLSAWSLWGYSLPTMAWTAFCVPVLGCSGTYLAFVAERLAPLCLERTAGCLS
jgi:hypothetical protein